MNTVAGGSPRLAQVVGLSPAVADDVVSGNDPPVRDRNRLLQKGPDVGGGQLG